MINSQVAGDVQFFILVFRNSAKKYGNEVPSTFNKLQKPLKALETWEPNYHEADGKNK